MLRKKIVLLATCAIVFACSEQVPRTTNATATPAAITDIDGNWNSLCEAGAQEYVQYHVSFERGRYTERTQFHPDANCQQVVKTPTVIEGTFVLKGDILTPEGVRAQQLDIALQEGEDSYVYEDIVTLVDGVMYFGQRATNERRPSRLDMNNPYYRQ